MFSIQLKRQALKFLKSLEPTDRSRIVQKIDTLLQEPFAQDAVRVQGYDAPKVFRIRVGHYRVLYFVDYSTSELFVVRIDTRSRVYDQH